MLLPTMNNNEVYNEITKDADDIYKTIVSRYFRKNQSVLKNMRIKPYTIMVDTNIVTKRYNKVRLILVKGENKELLCATIFKVTANNGSYRYYVLSANNIINVFTSHYMDRLLQRGGMTAKEFFRSVIKTAYRKKVNWNNKEIWVSVEANGISISEFDGTFYTYLTFVSEDMLYEEQDEFKKWFDENKEWLQCMKSEYLQEKINGLNFVA